MKAGVTQPTPSREDDEADVPGSVGRTAAASSVSHVGAATRPGERYLAWAEQWALVALFGAVVLFFTVHPRTSDTFATKANIDNVIGNQAVLAVVALAAMIPLICGRFDLSVGAVLGLSSIVSAKILTETGLPLAVAAVGGVAAGCLVGLANGLLIVKVRINALITTLGTATVLGGIQLVITGSGPILSDSKSLTDFGTSSTIGLPTVFLVLIAVAVVAHYLVEHTPYGRRLQAIGSSEPAARLVGISVDRAMLIAFVAAGGLAGAAGVVQLARSGAGDATIGGGFTLPAIAAAFLGATAIKPGRFNVPGTVVAIFFLAALVSGLTLMGAESWVQDMVNGTALVAGVAASTIIARQRLHI